MAQFADGRGEVAGPFTPALNASLSQAFGTSIADLSVARGVDHELQSIHADASTSGRTIGLASSIREDLSDPYSMEVIAHEVAHALADGGSGETLIDQPGDPGEHAAAAAGRAFAHFAEEPAGPAPRLQPAYGGRAAVHRHEIQGPFDVHAPIHESMTAESLRRAGLISGSSKYDSREAWEYTRGVMWNDDPTGQLFDAGNPRVTNNYSSGVQWYSEFSAGEKAAEKGGAFGPGASLLHRSHFGDMQFLHGMAPDGEDPQVTRDKMLMWAELTTSIAEGRIAGTAKLSELVLANPQFAAMLGDDKQLAAMDVNALFGVQEPGVLDTQARTCHPLQQTKPGALSTLQRRALGSLLHMVQDSFAEGHVQREDLGGGRMGKIENFHAYGKQSHEAHAVADGAPGPRSQTLDQRIAAKPGAEDAMSEGAIIASMIQRGIPVEDVVRYLETSTFAMNDDIGVAAPGSKFEKREPVRKPPRESGFKL